MKPFKIFVILACLCFSIRALPSAIISRDTNIVVTDYLNVPGPLTFDSSVLELAWSSHPNTKLYIQEYISNGARLDQYNKMLFIQVFRDNVSIEKVIET